MTLDLLSEWNWDIQSQIGQRASMNGFNFTAPIYSQMTTYWPFVLLQNEDLGFQQYAFDSGWEEWNTTSPTLQAYNGSSLTLIPLSSAENELSVLYQNGLNLTEYVETSKLAKTITQSKCRSLCSHNDPDSNRVQG